MLADRLSRLLNFGTARPSDPALVRFRRAFPRIPGIVVNEDTAGELGAAWACMRAIADALSNSPWPVYERVKGELVEKPDDGVAYLLNERPNPWMTAVSAKEAIIYPALLAGNGYAEIVPDGAGRVAELWPLDASRVRPRIEQISADRYRMYYEYTPIAGGFLRLEDWQVYHLRGPCSLLGLLGDNMVFRAARSISIAMSAEVYAAAYYANGGSVGTALKLQKGSTLTPETIDRLRSEWADMRGGPANSHKPVFLEDGMEVEELTEDAAKTQLLEVRKFSVEEMCRWFNVPPSRVWHYAGASGQYNNIEAAGIDWVNMGLKPWATRMRLEANYKLLSTRSNRVTELDLEWAKEGDRKSVLEGDKIAVEAGLATRNEIRRRRRQASLPKALGDVLTVPLATTTLELAISGDTLKRPAPPEDAAASEGETAPGGGKKGGDGEPETQPAEPAPPAKKAPKQAADVARIAIALDRFARRLAARRQDLERHAPGRAEENLVEERARLEPALLDELAAAGADRDAGAWAAAAVLTGAAPPAVAAKLAD
jgi:HK97 family phage portal protein